MSHLPSARHPLRLTVGTSPLISLLSVERGMLGLLLEIGVIGLFAAGVAAQLAGRAMPWAVLAVVLLGCALRAVDLENAALFIPGGSYGAAKQAFGKRRAAAAGGILFVEDVLFGALLASAAGASVTAIGLSSADLTIAVAVLLLGVVWLRARQGRARTAIERRIASTAVLIVVVAVVVHAIEAIVRYRSWSALQAFAPAGGVSTREVAAALAVCLFAMGAPDALEHAAGDFPQPKIRNLTRGAWLLNAFSIGITAGAGFLFVLFVPADSRAAWIAAPLASLPLFDGLPGPIGVPIGVVVIGAGVAIVAAAVERSAANARQTLLRLAEDGVLPRAMRTLHPRFGTPSRLIDLAATAQVALVLASAGQLTWIASAYGIAIAAAAVLKIAALVRLRSLRSEPRAFRIGFNARIAGHERPLGLLGLLALTALLGILSLAGGGAAAVAGAVLLLVVATALVLSERLATSAEAGTPAPTDVELLARPVVGVDHIEVRPGNLLVPIRRPGVLAHLASALQHTPDRDLVVMTARLVGVDASDEFALAAVPTEEERRLFADAAMLAERSGRAVQLLIVPATNVFDAVAGTAARLASSEIYVGESETLTDADQARLLGDAWERMPPPKPLDVRLVIRHANGRTVVFHLGAHAPTLTPEDLHLIHDLWLDVVKAVGPHVHHHDVVRAALTHMQEELHDPGPARDAALDRVRRLARPADELASAVRERDFARLRDMVRNRPPSDLAAVLTDLAPEDQVVAFRVLPRKVAAATFEYLSHDAQRTLLKAMAQEDVAAILNEMAPDDRTMFLEELPASATQQLLTLLTPDERSVAAKLLGYPEGSIGRLMTPDYIAVHEQWTIQQVLDYIRQHGQDSETLNVIYVVDDHGVLIDDLRIRELLLASPPRRVADLMDRRFVALNAADRQDSAIAVFRREDRSALPVTDTTGVLIGIVTIDDVIDVAVAATTKEIQRIGGSEALDEPYMQIAFRRMIQKRAGWLTALFLGEMLTATAMGAFEHEIERAVVLALFVPLIISSGGNSGSQASTLVIRAIALGEVQLRDWWRVIRREIGAGLALGAILGSIGVMRITIWSAFSTIYGPHWVLVALTVGLALVGVVMWGTLIGSLLPFLLRRLGFDPATSSAPFVATLVDVTGLVIYFSVGLLVLRGTLL